ncbi:glycosyl hydrolase family 67 [Leptospira fletcheri]|uniref:Glycosyl hydrolase family 67 n=1 Tax=Leptospira fletcheri TaxID=2484981 RepID=A0A4R9GJU5_9LEPT|nr:glycosyl hydrolase family 67 [Leptospira fletcheri]TGK13998.1 glycosyl hydrolase family 67 [Leptospira fletcheri]
MSKQFFLTIADTSAPFFLEHAEGSVNWSKAPLSALEKKKNAIPSKKKHRRVRESFGKYTKRIAEIGFNSVTVDELCYLVPHPFFPEELNAKIRSYRKKYKKLFKIARAQKLRIFLTADFLSFHPTMTERTKGDLDACIDLFLIGLDGFFNDFPEVDGIVLRIGESDGVDVRADFKSKLLLKTPEQTNYFLRRSVPIFEKHNKLMIFRTWTLGAYEVGDLIWNPETYRKVFRNIRSDSLVISMKYGEGDFFRYLRLNPLFLQDDRPKLLELQARREYEGFGEYPSFVGWLYERYRTQLRHAKNLVGLSVWTQTGGWSSFRNFTFLKNSSFWNELNAFVSLKLFTKDWSVEKCVSKFYQGARQEEFYRFLKLSDRVIEDLLYDPEFAGKTYYLHRVRLPPLLHVTWDRVTVSDPFRFLYSALSGNPNLSIRSGESAFPLLDEMNRLAEKLDLPYNHEFQKETFYLLLLCRKLLYNRDLSREETLLEEALEKAKDYHERYPDTYRFHILPRKNLPGTFQKFLLRLFVRGRSRYRILDRILYHPALRFLYYLVYLRIRRRLPSFLNQQAMPVRELLR